MNLPFILPALRSLQPRLCYIKSASDIGSAIALQLKTAGLYPLLVEQPLPSATRQHMCFAGAALTGNAQLAGLQAVRINPLRGGEVVLNATNSLDQHTQATLLQCMTASDRIPLWVGDLDAPPPLPVAVVVDARMRKKSIPPVQIDLAPLVIGIGSGFCAKQHCHAVVESNWGQHLGSVLWQGSSQAYTGVHRLVEGKGKERYGYASQAGVFYGSTGMLRKVRSGDVLGRIMADGVEVEQLKAQVDGLVRGLAYDGLVVQVGAKLVEVEPSGEAARCKGVQPRQAAIAQGVALAIASWRSTEPVGRSAPLSAGENLTD